MRTIKRTVAAFSQYHTEIDGLPARVTVANGRAERRRGSRPAAPRGWS